MLTAIFWLVLGSAAFAANTVPRVIAHGGGSHMGYNTTNSAEALDAAVKQGYTLIELDFALTTDNKLALLHDWPQGGMYYLGLEKGAPVSFDDYKKCKIMGKFTPLTIERVAQVLEANPDLRIITDTKDDNIQVLTLIRNHCPQVQQQFIPQAFNYDEVTQAKKLGYKNVILTWYKNSSNVKINELITFAQKNHLFAVTMPYELKDKGYAKKLQNAGVRVYFHTVNSLKNTVDSMVAGAYGVCSDTLLPEEVTFPSWQYYLTTSTSKNTQLAFEIQTGKLKLRMSSINQNDAVNYYIGDKKLASGKVNQNVNVALASIKDGAHTLTAKCYKANGQYSTSKRYYIWKDGSKVMLFGPQCKYLWQQYNHLPDLDTAAADYSAEVQAIAKNSFIVKVGSPVYYNNSNADMYRSGTAVIPAVMVNNQPHVPLRETMLELGAGKVVMNSNNKTMEITINGKKQTAVSQNAENKPASVSTTLHSYVTLHQNRAMVSGTLLSEATGRMWLMQGDYMVLLPKGKSVNSAQKAELFQLVGELY